MCFTSSSSAGGRLGSQGRSPGARCSRFQSAAPAAFLATWRPAAGWWRASRDGVALWCALRVVIVGPLWLLRKYQREHARLLHAIVDAPREDLAAVRVPARDGTVRFETPSLAQELPPTMGCMLPMWWPSLADPDAMR